MHNLNQLQGIILGSQSIMMSMEPIWCQWNQCGVRLCLRESAFSLRLAKLAAGNWPPSHKWLMGNALEDCNFELGQDLIDEERERQASQYFAIGLFVKQEGIVCWFKSSKDSVVVVEKIRSPCCYF